MARSRNKHKHPNHASHPVQGNSKPKRSVAVILAVIAAIMGLLLAWSKLEQGNLVWLPIAAAIGAFGGYLLGHTIDNNLGKK